MIPKVIHYCWFGKNPKPKLFYKCFKSWKKYCPDYQIMEWNESNYSIEDAPLYVKEAYENKKWAFVSDYARLQIIFEQGGIYLDTDVELVKSLNSLLEKEAYFGFEDGKYVNTGLGFGAIQGFSLLKEMMDDYHSISFVQEDGTFDLTPCPQRNTAVFLKHGLIQNDTCQQIAGAVILPSDFLATRNWKTGDIMITENTRSIHHAEASWYSLEMKQDRDRRFKEEKRKHLPSRAGEKIFGKKLYQRIRQWIKR